jgi:DNA-binding NarL/FixJ family response regulator
MRSADRIGNRPGTASPISQISGPRATLGRPGAEAGKAWNNANVRPREAPRYERSPTRRLGAGAAEISRKPLRLLIADDQSLVRAGVCELVKLLPEVVVIAQAGDGSEALRLVDTHHPDIIVMDVEMRGMNGLEATVLGKKKYPHVKIILLSEHSGEEFVIRALQSGAEGFVLKDDPVEELHTAIHSVAGGARHLTSTLTGKVALDYLERRSDSKESIKITPRQREVLQLIAEGKSTKEIANLLHLSTNTIKTHRVKLMEKLGVHEVTGVVRYAAKLGLVKT